MGEWTLEHRPFDNHAKATMPNIEDEYAELCALLAAEMAFAERKTFTEFAQEETEYVRVAFEAILLTDETGTTQAYPSAKIYRNGVCIVSLRIFSPDGLTTVEDLIDKQLNLSHRYFGRIDASARFLEAASIAEALPELAQADPETILAYDPSELIQDLIEPGFTPEEHGLRPYVALNVRNVVGYTTLEFVWALLENSIDAIALRPPRLTYAAHRTNRSYDRTWFQHANVLLLRWKGQPDRAHRMRPHLHAIAKVLSRSEGLPASAVPKVAVQLPRLFDDYCAFANEAVSVYAFGRQGLRVAAPEDEAFQRLAFPMQTNEEMALWLVASYRSSESQCEHVRNIASLRRLQQEKRTLDGVQGQISNFGELGDFFESFLTHFGLPKTVARIERALGAAETRMKDRTTARLARFGAVLAALFGLVGSGQLADAVVTPLRISQHLPLALRALPAKSLDYLIAVIAVLVLVLAAWLMAKVAESRDQ